jgi:hypothetical protein
VSNSAMERRDLAAAIRRASHLVGEFRLSSGAVAHRHADYWTTRGRTHAEGHMNAETRR